MTFETTLRDGAGQLGLTISDIQVQQLLAYLDLLIKWNKTYNLTSIRDPKEMVSKHLLDSLSVINHLPQGKTLLDVGSGAGLPGIPLAICLPQQEITLVESNGKKTAFLRQVKMELALDNLHVEDGRVEALSGKVFEVIISRAFSSLKNFIELTEKLMDTTTTLVAMKGKFPQDELSELPKNYMVSGSCELVVPGCVGERHLLNIVKKQT